MIPLSQVVIAEKNKLASDSAYIVLFEIALVGLEEIIRVCLNTESIFWNDFEWIPFPVELDDIDEGSKGEVPSLNLKISNVDRVIQGYMEKGRGGVGGTVVIRVVNSKHLDVSDLLFEEEFTITKATVDQMWATFTLGASYPMTARRPLWRHLSNHCPHEYGGPVCGVPPGVVAQYPTCNKSLVDCRIRANSPRFGGEPAIPGGMYV